MTIYDVKFYGVYFWYNRYANVNMFKEKKYAYCVPGFNNCFFEITLIKEYEGNKDVLKLVFDNKKEVYMTLRYPYLFFTNNVWKKSKRTFIQEKFEKNYFQIMLENVKEDS